MEGISVFEKSYKSLLNLIKILSTDQNIDTLIITFSNYDSATAGALKQSIKESLNKYDVDEAKILAVDPCTLNFRDTDIFDEDVKEKIIKGLVDTATARSSTLYKIITSGTLFGKVL